MKIDKIKILNNLPMHGGSPSAVRLKDESASCKQNNNDKLHQNRPANRQGLCGSERLYSNVSFGTNPKYVQNIAKEALEKGAKDLPKWADKMGAAKWFDKVLHSVDKNEAFYEAAVALVVAGMLKPLCVLAMPGAEKEDKEMAATKNFVSAFVGFGVSNLILGPCSNAVNKITDSFSSSNPTKYVKDIKYVEALKNDNLVGTAKSTLGEAFKSSYKKFPDLGVSPLKAGITIALTPIVLNSIFKKDKKDKAKKMKPVENPMSKMSVMNSIRIDSTKKTSEPSFKGGLNSSPSFKGGDRVSQVIDLSKETIKKTGLLGTIKNGYTDALGEPIAKLYGKLSGTKAARKIIEGTSHFDKPSPRWSDLASFAITFFYVNNTRKSEKIDEDRKLPLMINNVMVTAASSAAAATLDKITDKPMENILKGYIKHHEVELHDKSNIHIKKVLSSVKDNLHPTDADKNSIKNLMKNGREILENGADGLSEHLQDAIRALNGDGVVKKAIQDGLIKSEEVAEMAAAGFSQQASKVFNNMAKTKSLTIFTITVRFLVTVLMTPVIGKVVAIVKKKMGKDQEAKDKKAQNPIIPSAGSETIGMKDYINSLNK